MASVKPTAAVVVDPYSSGRYLLYELKSRNVPIICIRSSLKLGDFFLAAYDKNKEYFDETLDYEENLPKLLGQLDALPYKVGAVFPGCEPGVALADILAEALNLPTANGTKLAKARKDKAEMQEQLRRCGVPACEQIVSGDLDELLKWTRAHGRWPLVAKPTCSSGSDGIYFCKSEQDVIAAQRNLVGTMGPNGTFNAAIVLQEFLDGTEYIVDTVSYNGQHLCCAMWVYTKRRGTPWNPTCIISEGNRLLPSDGELQDQLADYAFKVLDAVGLRFGPCHTEVMMTARGPKLVEVNARLHGLQGPQLIGLATGTSQATYAVDALLGGARIFKAHYKPGPERYLYPLHKECLQMVLISPTEGYLERGIANAIYSLRLPSVIKVLPSTPKGKWLKASCDLNTTAGFALLLHESAEQLESDRARIRREEDCGLYRVSSEAPPEMPMPSPTESPLMPPLPSMGAYPISMSNSPDGMSLGMMGASPGMTVSPSLSPMPSSHLGTFIMQQQQQQQYQQPAKSPKLQSLEKVAEVWQNLVDFNLEGSGVELDQ